VQLIQVVLLAAVLLILVVALVLIRRRDRSSPPPRGRTEVVPSFRLRPGREEVYVTPEAIELPASGRLRIGYHPPFMDRHVGSPEFRQMPFVDVRGNAAAVHELSRHVGCVWRDPKSGDCYIQLGWPGPGEPIRPRGQTRVLRLGRPHDATSQPFRLVHGDVLRMTSGVEYVFQEVDTLRDRTTPEQRKMDVLAQPYPVAGAHDARR
jgi:hypothetical protein